MITKFSELFEELKQRNICKKLVVAWGVDEHSIEAAYKAVEAGFVTATIVGDEAMVKSVCEANGFDASKFEIINNPVELKAVAQAVQMVHDGNGDVLMKGLCSTDKFLRAILNRLSFRFLTSARKSRSPVSWFPSPTASASTNPRLPSSPLPSRCLTACRHALRPPSLPRCATAAR